MQKKYYSLFLLGEGILGFVFLFSNFSFPCFFKTIFKIPCPGCGLTRAFRAFIHLQFSKAIHYHIFSIPLFLLIFALNGLMIYDIWKGTDFLKRTVSKMSRYWFVFLFLLILSEIINLYRYFY